MIKLEVFGGLGNQLFEYAYARSLSLEYNEPIVINKNVAMLLLSKIRFPSTGNTDYQLKYFNITDLKIQNPIIGFIQSIPPALHACIHRINQNDDKKMSNLFLKMTSKGKYYYADTATSRYFAHNCTNAKIKHIHGNFCSDKYFLKYEDIIKKELSVTTEISEANQLIIDEINNCNSVAVHFRRGDYVTEKKLAMSYDFCNENYYLNGMNYIAERISNPIFFIFSNDINWVKNNIKSKHYIKYMENNNPGYEDLRLMYNCKHFIIANSTFSWWGSYLSNYNDKIIIAPDIWNKLYPNARDIYREDMILINV